MLKHVSYCTQYYSSANLTLRIVLKAIYIYIYLSMYHDIFYIGDLNYVRVYK